MWSILMFGAGYMKRWKKQHVDVETLTEEATGEAEESRMAAERSEGEGDGRGKSNVGVKVHSDGRASDSDR